MLTMNDIDEWQDKCHRQLELKKAHAAKGHDWVVDSHSFDSYKLLQLLHYAKMGVIEEQKALAAARGYPAPTAEPST